ncbi:site-specific DNA-methyltransferase [Butyricicoccus sp. Marseille-Q5471]|uniref:site-specific DNA-methyltransferase n=1 Tax=Butyricicoccus sp. Marseille-Q5471 TaxID=3039493 RepID=UPI0024BC777F|nr:DNA methyltransferase [Butyricicoccus sp. Marseille-Q5471]
MAALNDLINQVEDKTLRERLMQEAARLTKQKKFGLVYEEHIPECTPLYGIEIKRGSTVAKKAGAINDVYRVTKINGDEAECLRLVSGESETTALTELVPVAKFGEPIYPALQPIDKVENAPDSDLWHTLIEADNYHALQLLEYLYPKQIDCIYIDPPYNTGARDWKYNNDYVDSSDSWRHSKWLSMMQKRLKIAKRILNPNNSVLIVTIDEKEYLHLGCLLEEMFPEANIQMISSVISRKGAARTNEFTRVNEFIFFVMIGNCSIIPSDNAEYALEGESIHWQSYRRSSAMNVRTSRPRQFYPIYVDVRTNKIVEVGNAIAHDVDRFSVKQLPHCEAVFPVRDDGTEMLWGLTPNACRNLVEKGYLKAARHTPNKPQLYVIQYLMSGTIRDIENGVIQVTGYADDGSVLASNIETKKIMPRTQWNFDSHDARDFGTKILKNVIGELRFDFPKSLYAVHDCLLYFLADKKDALIVDFFAGSGTTLHAVNLLNTEDNGHRRCIMVTNNEVSYDEARRLTTQGFQPGDPEWEKLGIARYVTWPRTVCSIEGHDINGVPLKGDYLANDSDGNPIPMSQGFKANCEYFKLGFLDKDDVALGRQFKEILPLLWLKAGAIGKRPELHGETPDMLILTENKLAVLVSESSFMAFDEQLDAHPEIDTVFIVTDSEKAYREMIYGISAKHTYQLYRSYLDNFRINARR